VLFNQTLRICLERVLAGNFLAESRGFIGGRVNNAGAMGSDNRDEPRRYNPARCDVVMRSV
jgi:hypothetical protein